MPEPATAAELHPLKSGAYSSSTSLVDADLGYPPSYSESAWPRATLHHFFYSFLRFQTFSPDVALISVLLTILLCTQLFLVRPYPTFEERSAFYAFPLRDETVSDWELFVFSFCLPAVLLGILGHLSRSLYHSLGYPRFMPLVGLAVSYTLAATLTTSIKYYISFPRPNFFSLCNYAGFRTVSASTNGDPPKAALRYYLAHTNDLARVDLSKCEDAAHVWEGLEGFPSGHAALSVAGMWYCALLILLVPLERFRAPDRNRDPFLVATIRYFLAAALVAFALWIAATRVRDYWHDEAQVTLGLYVSLTSLAKSPTFLLSFAFVLCKSPCSYNTTACFLVLCRPQCRVTSACPPLILLSQLSTLQDCRGGL